jgi:hypothetical protein
METNSESPIIIQMLKNVKSLIELSKGRDCWTSDELPNINITYHNVCEIAKQLEEREPKRFEEIKEDLEPELDESIEIN